MKFAYAKLDACVWISASCVTNADSTTNHKQTSGVGTTLQSIAAWLGVVNCEGGKLASNSRPLTRLRLAQVDKIDSIELEW